MIPLFGRSRQLERQVDNFLDIANQAALVFPAGIEYFLAGREHDFEDMIKRVTALEAEADHLRRDVETELYTHTLIPESRGDVLALLENTDQVINSCKDTLKQFEIEIPDIPEEFHYSYNQLAQKSAASMEALVRAVRAFFKAPMSVGDYLHKVHYFERESDRIAEDLKRAIFRSELDLARKSHLRYFAFHIEQLADLAENVADRLAIYTIKRSV